MSEGPEKEWGSQRRALWEKRTAIVMPLKLKFIHHIPKDVHCKLPLFPKNNCRGQFSLRMIFPVFEAIWYCQISLIASCNSTYIFVRSDIVTTIVALWENYGTVNRVILHAVILQITLSFGPSISMSIMFVNAECKTLLGAPCEKGPLWE